jgi:hypothetical protein
MGGLYAYKADVEGCRHLTKVGRGQSPDRINDQTAGQFYRPIGEVFIPVRSDYRALEKQFHNEWADHRYRGSRGQEWYANLEPDYVIEWVLYSDAYALAREKGDRTRYPTYREAEQAAQEERDRWTYWDHKFADLLWGEALADPVKWRKQLDLELGKGPADDLLRGWQSPMLKIGGAP